MGDFYSFLTFVSCASFIFFFLRFFGCSGLYVYSLIAVISANIQVLKVSQYSFFESPIPLGTVIFSTMFAVDNIINEHFGAEKAKKCVYIGFAGYLCFSILMILADLHPNVINTSCANMYKEIHLLFSPSIALFISSIIAYLISNLCDIYVFSFLKNRWSKKFLGLRSAITMVLSTFVDNIIFSLLAWKILSSIFIPWSDIVYTYILGTNMFRLFITVCCIPIVKISGKFVSKDDV